MLGIFDFDDKNLFHLSIISTLQLFFTRLKVSLISHKTIQLIPNIKDSQFNLKIPPVVSKSSAIFHLFFLYNTSQNSEMNSPNPTMNVVCKYLRQFLGTSFRVYTLPSFATLSSGEGPKKLLKHATIKAECPCFFFFTVLLVES